MRSSLDCLKRLQLATSRMARSITSSASLLPSAFGSNDESFSSSLEYFMLQGYGGTGLCNALDALFGSLQPMRNHLIEIEPDACNVRFQMQILIGPLEETNERFATFWTVQTHFLVDYVRVFFVVDD